MDDQKTPAPPHAQHAADAHGDHAFAYRPFTSDTQNEMTRLQPQAHRPIR